jgi:hypothetical protein
MCEIEIEIVVMALDRVKEKFFHWINMSRCRK